jgi:hypothetical protein
MVEVVGSYPKYMIESLLELPPQGYPLPTGMVLVAESAEIATVAVLLVLLQPAELVITQR